MKSTEQKTILFPTDFSDVSIHALDFAIDLCEREECKLLLLNVVDAPFSRGTDDEAIEIDLITKDLIHFSQINLEKLKSKILKKHTIGIEEITYTGNTTLAISKAVSIFNATKIVMGTKVNKDLFFKSNSFTIVNNTSIPLLTVSMESKNMIYKNILFPFNEKLMTLKKADDVIHMAKLYKSKVILLGISEANTSDKIHIITNNMMDIKSLFDDHQIPCEIHFNSNSNYAGAILAYCSFNHIDLITIANNLPNVLTGILNFNSAKNVINNSEIPVLTIPVSNH